jgi:hypothetical protein
MIGLPVPAIDVPLWTAALEWRQMQAALIFCVDLSFQPPGLGGNFCHLRVIVTCFIVLSCVAPQLVAHTTLQSQL